MTRKDYLEGRVTHHEYYLTIAREAGINYAKSSMLPRVKAALAAGDQHLNTIPLQEWDSAGFYTRPTVARVMKQHEDFWSMADSVCVHKAAARQAAEESEPS